MELIKKKRDYEEIRAKLEVSEETRLHIVLLLMELKPYRRSIFTQVFDTKHIIHKEWVNMSYESKIIWIKQYMFTKWSKPEFIDHIITSIKTLSFNSRINQSFEMVLETY